MGDDETVPHTKFPLEAIVDIEFDASDVVAKLKPLEVVNLVRELDNEVGYWEHTLLLYHHFLGQFEIAKSKVPELAAMDLKELEAELQKIAEEQAVAK